MRRFLLLLAFFPLPSAHAQTSPVVIDDLAALNRAADRCDADISGNPNIDGCGAIYNALTARYGGYPAYFAARLDRLHAIASKCDADVSGIPDIDTCGPVYTRLVNWYGDYSAYRAAVAARASN